MGSWTDARIAAWQEQSGIKPATGKRAGLLSKLSNAAFETIKLIELEMSGIRDGDGYWHGSDPMHGMLSELAGLCGAANNEIGF
jgi:hypothetical protein